MNLKKGLKACFTWVKKRSFNQIYLVLTLINIAFTFYTYKTNLKPEPQPLIICDIDNALFITQTWGNVAFNQNILITNYGNAMGTVYSVDAFIEYKDQKGGGGFGLNVTAQNTYENGQSHRLLPINLGASGWVDNQYSLYQTIPDREIDFINRLTDSIDKERRASSGKYQLTYSTKASISRYVNNKIKKFKAGDYAYLLCFRDDQHRIFRNQCFTFTLSETNVWLLQEYTKNIIEPGSASKQAIFIHLKKPDTALYRHMLKKYLHI